MGAAIARHTHLNPAPPVIVLAVWDSVTQKWKPPFTDDSVYLCKTGNLVVVNGNVKFNASGTQNYTMAHETIPV